ncbi:PD-(D/E)XK nuclease superfamily [Bifidobacterium parmae]|uniref:PD-(D/E)XK nuclease superfamily n=2 Tax=Bifidobacterium parmae TaxID=361854 RepID=A0A2N5IWH4_9BIFI|nr:PD-(D/E)XK nuclease superfamily [Bifidobacterium parmae]
METTQIEVQAMRMLADDDFLALNSRLNRPNIFEAVNLGHAEIRHSAFIAWLADPSNPHGLEDLFLRRLIAELFKENPNRGFASLAADDLTDVNVIRESESNIDLLIRTRDDRLALCLENKVFAGLHDHQLDKYHRYVEGAYGDKRFRLYVFLTPDGHEPPEDECDDSDAWMTFSYPGLAGILESLKPYANERTCICIEDYIDVLKKENIMADDELDELAKKLYARYRDVFDLVNERCSDQSGVEGHLRNLYLEVLNEYRREGLIADCSPMDFTGKYLSFHTKAMDEYLHNDRTRPGTWGNPSDTYHYWVYPPLLKPTINLELGPLGQPDWIIRLMENVRRVAGGKNKPISPHSKYRTPKKITTDIDATDAMNVDDLPDDKDIQGKLRKAIDEMLRFETGILGGLRPSV